MFAASLGAKWDLPARGLESICQKYSNKFSESTPDLKTFVFNTRFCNMSCSKLINSGGIMASALASSNSVQTSRGSGGLNSLLADAAPSLAISSGPKLKPLLELVTQYLFPEPEGWVTEWTGPRGYDVTHDAVTNAGTSLMHDEISLVVQYLKKSDIFGLADLEKAAGGKEELRKLLFGERGFIMGFLFGEKTYNAQKSLPLDIDDEMQAALSTYFDDATLRSFPNARKVTQLYSLYWCPAGMKATIAEQIAKKHGQQFDRNTDWESIIRGQGNPPASVDCWVQFPNVVVGRGKTVQELEALIPAGFEFPHFRDTIFCIFVKYACTRKRIMPNPPPGLRFTRHQELSTFTWCREEVRWSHKLDKLVVGGFEAREGLQVSYIRNDPMTTMTPIGVAPLRKLY